MILPRVAAAVEETDAANLSIEVVGAALDAGFEHSVRAAGGAGVDFEG